MPRQAVGAEQESATPFADRELRLSNNGGGGGNRTRRSKKRRDHTDTASRHKTITKQHITALAHLSQTTRFNDPTTELQRFSTTNLCTRCVRKLTTERSCARNGMLAEAAR
jgi:hypothetical protein